jgi:hypothetical protein
MRQIYLLEQLVVEDYVNYSNYSRQPWLYRNSATFEHVVEHQQSEVQDLEMEVPNSHPHPHLPQWVVDPAFHHLHPSQRSFPQQSKVRTQTTTGRGVYLEIPAC